MARFSPYGHQRIGDTKQQAQFNFSSMQKIQQTNRVKSHE
jgi:hypothetical protein